ncbi:hypothetical protein ABW19_dt0208238 [Dactylella cylindrospora]|nr:hypothetical protein ABW19_dt0208238 [Dactylella cylindrospora]
MVLPRSSSGELATDISSSSLSPSSLSASDRALRRRTYHGPTQSSQSSSSSANPVNTTAATTTTTTTAAPGTRASGRTNSNPNVASKFSRFSSRATAKRLFQQIVSSGGFSAPQPVEIRPSPVPQTAAPAPAASASSSVPDSPPSPPPVEISPQSSPPPAPTQRRNSATNIPTTATSRNPRRMSPPTMVAIGGGNTGIPSHQLALQSLQSQSPRGSSASLAAATRHSRSGSVGSVSLSAEKPLAITSGGQMSLDIRLAEPYLFLQGYETHQQQNAGSPALLRGNLVLKITKAAKIKAITLTFKGRARTDWPEGMFDRPISGFQKVKLTFVLGIPPSKTAFYEEKEIMTHTWPFFNAQFPSAERTHGADSTRLLVPEVDPRCSRSNSGAPGAIGSLARTSSPIGISAASAALANDKRLSLQLNQNKSFNRSDSPGRTSVTSKGYRMFLPGEYSYNFELPIESILPETIQCELGSVKYELEATVERAGAFRPNLVGKKDVTLIRCPADTSLEQVEPIAISRNWEDQLHYDIVISGKSFPMGSQIPIAFKLTPLAKVRCHRIKIYVTENIEYFCRNKKVHRIEPTRKIQVYEKRADGPVNAQYPGSTARILSGGREGDPDNPNSELEPNQRLGDNLLGNLEGDIIGPTEMEFMVRLPGCGAKEGKIHFDTTYRNIQVHHWIKIVMRLSKLDPNDPTKRRHFEISIDSPFHILSCKCSHANISLPAYTDHDHSQQPATSCNCPNPRRDSPPFGAVDSALPDTAPDGVPRPMHLMRAPSFNPPAFDDDIAPPPLVTPPPHYESVGGGGLADYFSRLAADDEDTEDESPGSRVSDAQSPTRLARSLDERRTWVPAT